MSQLDPLFQISLNFFFLIFQQSQVIRGQNQIINIQNYDQIKVFFELFKNKHYGQHNYFQTFEIRNMH
jgi:hypothetical protein